MSRSPPGRRAVVTRKFCRLCPLRDTIQIQTISMLDRLLRPEYCRSHEPDRLQNQWPTRMLGQITRHEHSNHYLLIVIGAVVALLSVAVVVAFIRSRRLAKVPPPPPCKCPACGSEQISIFRSGLWDGEDSAGRGTGGTSQVGTCKSCGVHCEHFSVWDNDSTQSYYESRILTRFFRFFQ